MQPVLLTSGGGSALKTDTMGPPASPICRRHQLRYGSCPLSHCLKTYVLWTSMAFIGLLSGERVVLGHVQCSKHGSKRSYNSARLPRYRSSLNNGAVCVSTRPDGNSMVGPMMPNPHAWRLLSRIMPHAKQHLLAWKRGALPGRLWVSA